MEEDKVEALAGFFSTERRRLAAALRRRARHLSEMDAEDVISEVALRLFERPDLVRDVRSLAGYVYRALERRVVDWMRERKRVVPLHELGPEESIVAEREGYGQSAALRAAEDAEFRVRFFAALAALPAPQRAIWIATELEDNTFQELAERWGEPLGTLLARKHRATRALRAALHDLGPTT